jgi:maltooligosyltrehalose trehalohydrolase
MNDTGRLGAHPRGDGSTAFRVWAPKARQMSVKVVAPEPSLTAMERSPSDVFEAIVPGTGPGADYLYLIDGSKERPDPCSRYQPSGVHAASRVVSGDFAWSDSTWTGPEKKDLILYELHTGTFTPEGTFDAVIGKLGHLVDLGVNAIEIMPVAQFPGYRNWGYDGVFPYAPQASYGGPEGLKRLVDASHRRGIAVVLDVVYNHLGPEGNYLGDFGPYFSGRYKTPWGEAINYDGPDSDPVRAYFRENALYWLTDFHVDGLRFDAIQTIFDMSARHFLEETAAAFHERARELGRRAFVIAESDLNDVRVIQPPEQNGFGFDAQWCDDFHHAVSAAVTGTHHGYFDEYSQLADVAKAIREGFVFDGRYAPHRRRRHGKSSAREPGRKLVMFVQNHDQVANAWHGRRLATTTTPGRQRMAAALLFAHPGVPLLFMGQEFGEIAPFDFFTSHSDADLVAAVRRGRAEEFRGVGLAHPPDPQDERTFLTSKIDWSLLDREPHQETLRLYRDLIALRKSHPALRSDKKDLTRVRSSEAPRWLVIERAGGGAGEHLVFLLNFEDTAEPIETSLPAGTYRLVLSTEDIRYGAEPGTETPAPAVEVLQGQPAVVKCPAQAALIYAEQDRPRTF